MQYKTVLDEQHIVSVEFDVSKIKWFNHNGKYGEHVSLLSFMCKY